MNKVAVIICAGALVSWLAPVHLRANPSTKDPDALLMIRSAEKLPGDHLAADYAAIQARYSQAKAATDELWQKHEAKTLAIGDARKIGPLYLLQAAVRRDADYLKSRGEACGHDLSLRSLEMEQRLTTMVGELATLPMINRAALMNEVDKAYNAGLKRLPQIEGLIKRQQFFQAEGEKIQVFDNMMRNGIWLLGSGLAEHFRPFQTPLAEATGLRTAQVQAELLAVSAQGPDFARLQTELSQAATAISAGEQATWQGQTVNGPELLKAWNVQWPEVQAAAQRAAMADWNSEQLTNGASARYQARMSAQGQFAKALPAALAAIVQADAQRASGATAATLYREYVAIIGTLCALGPRQELEASFAPALTELAAKAGLAQEVAAYRAGTEPVLAWKRFFARAQAKALAGNHPRIHDWCTTVLKPPHQSEHTLVPNSPHDVGDVRIASTPNKVLPGVLPAGQTPLVVVGDIVPATAAGGRGVSRYQQRVYAIVAPPPADEWKFAGDQLEQSLLATPDNPPLTIEAATAVTSARLGVFESAGGPVDALTVEPLLTRFITLPKEAASLLPRGVLQADESADGTAGLTALAVRCDLLQPLWLQHECFVLQP